MKPKSTIARIVALVMLASTLAMPGFVHAAAQLTARSVTLSNSAGATAPQLSSYTAKFTIASSGQTLGSIKLEICDSPLSSTACVNTGSSNGATFTGATFGSVTCTVTACNGGGWSLGSASGNTAYVTHTAAAVTATPTITVVLNNVTNPNSNNKEFYVRISTYTATDTSAPAYPGTDFGGVALATAQQLTVSGVMPESLVFCVGTTWNTSCNDISGSAVDLGTFSPSTTSTGTSVMDASTNAGSGYAITVNGTTLTSGANTITACNPNCVQPGGTGTSQFGTNVVANTIPAVGANVTPTGAGFNGSAAVNYNTQNSFRFVNGETVASSGTVSNSQLFTNSYIVNVGGSQAAGLYAATITYICTATF